VTSPAVVSDGPRTATASPARPAWLRLLARPLGLYAASRVVTLAAMGVAAVVSPAYNFSQVISRWDSGWYLAVAEHGYPHEVPAAQSTIAFFPLYPLATRALQAVTGLPFKASALLVAGVSGLAAAILVWLLVRRVADGDAADRATALFCFFPGSFVLTMPYSEALMIALAAGCLLALVSRRWLAAGLAAGLATATRPNAVALVACCAWAAAGPLRRREWRAAAAPLLAPVGLLAFFGFLWARTGQAQAWWRVQRDGWDQNVDFGWTTVRQFAQAAGDPLADLNHLIAALSLVFVVVAGIALVRSRLPAVLSIYAGVVMAIALASDITVSRPRFLLTAFPLVIALARPLRGWPFAAVLGTSAALLGALTILATGTLAATP